MRPARGTNPAALAGLVLDAEALRADAAALARRVDAQGAALAGVQAQLGALLRRAGALEAD